MNVSSIDSSIPRVIPDHVTVEPFKLPPLEIFEISVYPLGTGSVICTPVATDVPSFIAVMLNSTVSPTTATALSTSLVRAISIIPLRPASNSVLISPLASEKTSDIPISGSISLSLVPLP